MIGISFLIRIAQFLGIIIITGLIIALFVYVITWTLQLTSEAVFGRFGGFRQWFKSKLPKRKSKVIIRKD